MNKSQTFNYKAFLIGILLAILTIILMSCEDDLDCCAMPSVFNLELRYDGDRLEFLEYQFYPILLLLQHYLNMLLILILIIKVRNLWIKKYNQCLCYPIFFCTADGENYTQEVKANFYEDRTTILLIEEVIGCEPTIEVIYG